MQRLFNKRFRRSIAAGATVAGPRFPLRLQPRMRSLLIESKLWLIWSVTVVFLMVQVTSQLTTGLMADGLTASYHLGPASLAVLIASYYVIYAPMQGPAGMLLDRYGPRLLLSAGGVIFGLGTFLFSTSHSLWVAIVGRMIMGLGVSFAFTGCLNVGARWFSTRVVRSLVVILEIFSVFAVVLGNMIFPHWLEVSSWRTVTLCLGGVGLAAGVFIAVFVTNTPTAKSAITHRGSAMIKRMGYKKTMLGICKRPAMWINGIYCGVLFSLVTVLSGLYGIPYLQVAKHLSLSSASNLDALLLWGVIVGCAVIAVLQKYIKKDVSVMRWTAWALAVLSISVACYPFLPLWAIKSSLLILGALCTVYVLNFKVCTRLLSPALSGSSIGFTNMLMVAVAPVLQLTVGMIIWALGFFFKSLVATQLAMLAFPVFFLIMGQLIARVPQAKD